MYYGFAQARHSPSLVVLARSLPTVPKHMSTFETVLRLTNMYRAVENIPGRLRPLSSRAAVGRCARRSRKPRCRRSWRDVAREVGRLEGEVGRQASCAQAWSCRSACLSLRRGRRRRGQEEEARRQEGETTGSFSVSSAPSLAESSGRCFWFGRRRREQRRARNLRVEAFALSSLSAGKAWTTARPNFDAVSRAVVVWLRGRPRGKVAADHGQVLVGGLGSSEPAVKMPRGR